MNGWIFNRQQLTHNLFIIIIIIIVVVVIIIIIIIINIIIIIIVIIIIIIIIIITSHSNYTGWNDRTGIRISQHFQLFSIVLNQSISIHQSQMSWALKRRNARW